MNKNYKGYEIREWSGPYGEFPDKGDPKYFVQTKDAATGLNNCPTICPKAWSLREATEKINWALRSGIEV